MNSHSQFLFSAISTNLKSNPFLSSLKTLNLPQSLPTVKQALVSFLTVNYQQAEVTRDLLESLLDLEYSNWECIVVDNGGPASNLQEICSAYEQVTFLRSEENLGFAGGNNLGYPECKGDYIFLINNDTEVPPDFLEPLLKFAAENPKLGALSPLLQYYEPKGVVQYAGATPMNKVTLRNSGIGVGEKDEGQYHKAYQVPFTHGAAMMLPREVIEKVGLMREDYFLYYEELDWCERIRQAGYEIWFVGHSFLRHKESVSTGVNSPLKTYYLNRNRLLFARRNYPWYIRVINYIYFSLIAVPKNLLTLWKNGEKAQAAAFWRAFKYNLTHKSSDSADRY